MPLVEKLTDQNDLVKASKFPEHATFPFEYLNPVQSRIFEMYDQDCNVVISAATSSGKTLCAEMMMAEEVRKRGGKAMYLAPLRALAKEKIDDWTDPKHHFSDLKLSICTGDYRLTPARRKEMEASNIILMTSEMLNSRCRNFKSEQNEWLKSVKTLVVDEAHLLTVLGRGDHLEVGLMNFCKMVENTRLVLLSATMPNVQEIAEWVANVLNKKKTYLLESTFRPCPLGVHFEIYDDHGMYDQKENEKVESALQIVQDYPEDRFLLFVHTKRTGHKLKSAFAREGLTCEFHNADLEKSKRHALESKFRNGKLKYIIATSTLAWGLNLPARRVIILGMHRGLSEVDSYDIWQMAGRAGRPGYDPRGDVYVLLPKREESIYRDRLQNPQPIDSKLLDNAEGHYKTLAFHLVSEIHHGGIKTKKDVLEGYKRTLAHFQAKDLDDIIVNSTIELLLKFGAIKEENGIYKVTTVGLVSSMFYYSPFDVADLRRNFTNLFNEGREDDEIHCSMALANVDSIRMGIVSKAEREEIGPFLGKVCQDFGRGHFLETAIKGGFCYFCSLKGKNAGNVASTARLLQWDFPRLVQVLCAIDSIGCKWDKKEYFESLGSRVTYGVEPHLLPFVKLPDIGKVRAERLWSVGIKSLHDVAADPVRIQRILNMRAEKIQNIVEAAKGQILLGV